MTINTADQPTICGAEKRNTAMKIESIKTNSRTTSRRAGRDVIEIIYPK